MNKLPLPLQILVDLGILKLSRRRYRPDRRRGKKRRPARIVYVLTLGSNYRHKVPDSVLAHLHGWTKSIDSKFYNIDHLSKTLVTLRPLVPVPQAIITYFADNLESLQDLISTCKSSAGSADLRRKRDILLGEMVDFCLVTVRIFLYEMFDTKVMTAEQIHELGFLLPHEKVGGSGRSKPTDAIAAIKVVIKGLDAVEIVFDYSAGKNAGEVRSGWPKGVRHGIIVILSEDGRTEILRLATGKLHNTIMMPPETRGKLLIAKVAFLKHLDDIPVYGEEPMFMMPKTTEDASREEANEIARLKAELEKYKSGQTPTSPGN
ncbi:MAG: hypothetical protein LBI96_00005 [Odoribacteraceae bacterium]|jgi:hypothetical protein|nr:hypothetical protein [Odoribacteraceae bacterium]